MLLLSGMPYVGKRTAIEKFASEGFVVDTADYVTNLITQNRSHYISHNSKALGPHFEQYDDIVDNEYSFSFELKNPYQIIVDNIRIGTQEWWESLNDTVNVVSPTIPWATEYMLEKELCSTVILIKTPLEMQCRFSFEQNKTIDHRIKDLTAEKQERAYQGMMKYEVEKQVTRWRYIEELAETKADHVIYNDSTIEDLKDAIGELIETENLKSEYGVVS